MNRLENRFNKSDFSRFLNSPAGRIFRLSAGIGFIVVGYVFRVHILGIVSILWGVLPLTAGTFDICYVSAALGGPLSGKKIRDSQRTP
jgi:hypothetical protein